MQDTEFYEALLGLSEPWRVTKVELDSSSNRVDVWIDDQSGVTWNCPECNKKVSLSFKECVNLIEKYLD